MGVGCATPQAACGPNCVPGCGDHCASSASALIATPIEPAVQQEPVVKNAPKLPRTPLAAKPGVFGFEKVEEVKAENAESPSNNGSGSVVGSFEDKPSSGTGIVEEETVDTNEDKHAALKTAISKVKSAALGTRSELKTFRKFLKPRYPTPGEAFDDLKGVSAKLSKRVFLDRMEELQYNGNSERLFNAFSTDSDVIHREVFKQRLVAIGRVSVPKKKDVSFGDVVLHVVKAVKTSDLQSSADSADAWDEPPPSIVPVVAPLVIDIPPESDPDSPKMQESAASAAQPAASGQPARAPRQQEAVTLSSPPNATTRKEKKRNSSSSPKGSKTNKTSLTSTEVPSGRASPKKDLGGGVHSLISPRETDES